MARARRCRCPPDSVRTSAVALSFRSTRASAHLAVPYEAASAAVGYSAAYSRSVSTTVSSGMNAVVCSCTPSRARNAPRRGGGIEAEHRHGARGGGAQPFEDLDECGLAGAVRTEQADDLAGAFDGQVEAAKRVHRAVGLLQTPHLNRCHGRHHPARGGTCGSACRQPPEVTPVTGEKDLLHFFGSRKPSNPQGLRAIQPPMDTLTRDLRHAFARLIRDRGFAAITIVTLALGIGANTAVFSLVKAALLSPLPYGDAERLTVIWGPDRARVHAPVAAGSLQLSARDAELRRHRGLPGIRRQLHRRPGARAGPRRVGDAEPVRGDAHAGDDRPHVQRRRYRRRHERRDRDQPRPVAAPLRRRSPTSSGRRCRSTAARAR